MKAIVRSLKGTPKCPICSKPLRLNASVEIHDETKLPTQEAKSADGLHRAGHLHFTGRGVCLGAHRFRVAGFAGSLANRPGQGPWLYECDVTSADPE